MTTSPDLVDAAAMLLRLLVGTVFLGHGLQKATHRLGGGGLAAEAAVLARDGIRGGTASAAASAVSQIGAGALLVIGLITPLAVAGVIGTMAVAIGAKVRHGFWVQNDGYEFPLFIAVTSAAIALVGPGSWSVDHALGFTPTATWSIAGIALGIAAGSGAAVLLRDPHATTPETDPA